MKKKSIWAPGFTVYKLLLLPAAIGINYIGKLFAQLLSLPLWLDSIGTLFASMLGGPIIGALAGLINNVLYGLLLDTMSFAYGITSIAMGLLVGGMSLRGFLGAWYKVLVMGAFVALLAAIVSTPLNILFWGGETGIMWADSFAASLQGSIPAVWLTSFIAELAVDIPDKILSVFLSFGIYKALPKNLLRAYNREDGI